MVDCKMIAEQYAQEHKCDIIEPSAEHNGYKYFHIDYTGRARYTGHPHIIKIKKATGKVQWVLDVDEIYWAFKLRVKSSEKSS